MCFSATASFTASGVIGSIGVATLSKTSNKSERPLASIPLLFGMQQLVEGIVWLSFKETQILPWNYFLTFVYSLFSHVLWPVFVPFAVFSIETEPRRRKHLKYLVGLGALVSSYLLFFMIYDPISSEIVNHSVRYNYHHHFPILTMSLYLISVCLSCLISSILIVRILGVALIVSFSVAYLAFTLTFFSVWCFFAAVLSLILFYYFWKKSNSKLGGQ